MWLNVIDAKLNAKTMLASSTSQCSVRGGWGFCAGAPNMACSLALDVKSFAFW